MTRETDYLIQSLFERESLEEMTLDELKGLSEQYPFSSIIQFLYTCKLKSLYHLEYPEMVSKTALYFEDPFWLDYQLSDEQDFGKIRLGQFEKRLENSEDLPETTDTPEWKAFTPLSTQEDQSDNTEEFSTENSQVENEVSIPIEPYHTIDYFASQGIKLSQEDEKDDLGKKVKSFTAWLKTMKRLQPEPENITTKDLSVLSDPAQDTDLASETVVTESMAAVYLKQGLTDKAIEIYQKLSLQNPANSHIFASRISSIKENRL